MSLSKFSGISSLTDFDREFPTEQTLIHSMMEAGLLKGKRTCKKCAREMKLRVRKEQLEWRCRIGKKDCSCKSVKSGSWFQSSNLSLKTSMKMLIAWVNRYSGLQIEKELSIGHTTVVDWKNMFRGICAEIELMYPPIGGEGKIVEIDETCVHGRKYGRGKVMTEQLWVYEGVERGSRRSFMGIVPDRSARTLLPILKRHVDSRSTIISDQWKSYATIKNHFQRHETINHSNQFQRFADDGLDVNTNSIEALWTRLKDPLKKANGTSDELLPSYISEKVVREREGDNFFFRILEHIKVRQ
ncbi:hypothetical protein CRE_20983 [Caenorhabditis remanei]|uniref:ISXO2-like transposase domain-containing protein n=1 Tax=Caenorhabditis remanei TaxID=31234 RepID=E3NHM6_CAERE|nr:hypothetical protein CRE_20983 [Caenorhabditis remanei]